MYTQLLRASEYRVSPNDRQSYAHRRKLPGQQSALQVGLVVQCRAKRVDLALSRSSLFLSGACETSYWHKTFLHGPRLAGSGSWLCGRSSTSSEYIVYLITSLRLILSFQSSYNHSTLYHYVISTYVPCSFLMRLFTPSCVCFSFWALCSSRSSSLAKGAAHYRLASRSGSNHIL
jgi:hypothetical protein